MSDSYWPLFVPPLAGLEGQGCGSLGGGSSPAGVGGIAFRLPGFLHWLRHPSPCLLTPPCPPRGLLWRRSLVPSFPREWSNWLLCLLRAFTALFAVWKTSGSWHPVMDLCHLNAANPLDLFFTSNPQNYTYTVSSPLRSSDHCTVSVTSTFTPPPPIPPTQRHLWHFENARRADMSNFLLDFPWDDYCFRTRDPDLAATAVGEVVDSGMRAYIPYSLTTFSPSKPWLDCACSSAISDREGAHQSYQASPSELTHAAFISARNRCSAKLRRARSCFHKRKIDKLNSSPTEKCFWSLSKKIFNNFCNSSFPSLIRPDGSIACSPTDKANLFGSYFSANSSLSDSNAPDPPTQPLYNPIPSIIISARKVRRVLRSLKTGKASGPGGFPPRFLKEFADELAPVLCRLFRLILISCTCPSSWKHALV